MRVRFLGFLLIALMALPAGWAAPAFFGEHVSATSATSSSTPCDGHEEHGDDCPCCPDHGGSMSDCLSVCAVSIAIPAAVFAPARSRGNIPPPIHTAAAFTSRADLPFKPPPIL